MHIYVNHFFEGHRCSIEQRRSAALIKRRILHGFLQLTCGRVRENRGRIFCSSDVDCLEKICVCGMQMMRCMERSRMNFYDETQWLIKFRMSNRKMLYQNLKYPTVL